MRCEQWEDLNRGTEMETGLMSLRNVMTKGRNRVSERRRGDKIGKVTGKSHCTES